MRKILRNIALLLLPILLYYAVFLTFEPNNYFGLRASTPSGQVPGVLQSYERTPQNSILAGDSLVAHMDPAQIEEAAGRPFANIAFGGASLRETVDVLNWWLEKYPAIDEVVLCLSFYTLNANYDTNRFEAIKATLNNPVAYLTNLSFHLDAGRSLLEYMQGRELWGGAAETRDPSTYEYISYTVPATGETITLRKDVAEHLQNMAAYTQNWAPNWEQVERLGQLIAACRARGLRFAVVLPPLHPATKNCVLQPQGIAAQMQPMLAALEAAGALVLDYEIENPPAYSEDMYFDAMHLDYERGRPVFTKTMFQDINAAWGEPGGEEGAHGP